MLSDPEQRAEYDQLRAMGSGARFTAGGAPGGFEDVFGGMFGAGARGRPATGRLRRHLRQPLRWRRRWLPGRWGRGFRSPQKGRDQTAEVSLEFMTAVTGDTVTLERESGRPSR